MTKHKKENIIKSPQNDIKRWDGERKTKENRKKDKIKKIIEN